MIRKTTSTDKSGCQKSAVNSLLVSSLDNVTNGDHKMRRHVLIKELKALGENDATASNIGIFFMQVLIFIYRNKLQHVS